MSHRNCVPATVLAVLLTVSPPSINFGAGRPGTSSFRIVQIANPSNIQTAVIQRIEVTPPFGIAANSCIGQLEPAVNCTITIFFVPPDNEDYKGRLLVEVLGKKAPLEVKLHGVRIEGK